MTLTCMISSDLHQEFAHPKGAIFNHFTNADCLIIAGDLAPVIEDYYEDIIVAA
jgi:Icc-related predicted phosphoesterase